MRRLYRSRVDKKIAGVCGGLGEYFRVDPTLIRLLVVLIGFFTAVLPILIAYLIAAIIIPVNPMHKSFEGYKKLYRSRKNKIVAGICAGIAEFFKMDPTIIRLIFVFLMIITAIVPMLLTYIIAWIIIPENPASFIDIEIKKG